MEEPDFWEDTEGSQKVMKELKMLKDTIQTAEELNRQFEDTDTLLEMAEEEEDASLAGEIREGIRRLDEHLEEVRISTLLGGEYDNCDAIVTLHAGAGGTEACDWNQMLYRMYSRFVERHGFSMEVLDYIDGDIAGIKNVTFEVHGENAYGFLKSEKGIHRLVRISPFNSAGKRQTSFASCDVIPDIDKDIDIEINEG